MWTKKKANYSANSTEIKQRGNVFVAAARREVLRVGSVVAQSSGTSVGSIRAQNRSKNTATIHFARIHSAYKERN
jgi:hypothetical protein